MSRRNGDTAIEFDVDRGPSQDELFWDSPLDNALQHREHMESTKSNRDIQHITIEYRA